MQTPSERVLELSPRESLTAILAIWPSRWSAPTVAAVHAMTDEDIEGHTPAMWIDFLNVLGERIDVIARRAFGGSQRPPTHE